MKTNKEVTPFCFGDSLALVVKDENENSLFVAKDVASALGYVNTRDAIITHCKKGISAKESGIATLHPQTQLILEPDVYRLIVKSTLPEAEQFEAWIFEEVLPAIRKTGTYQMPGSDSPNLMDDAGVRRSGNMYFPMAKLVESADKYLEGKAALKALNYFTGMPVDDLLEELDERKLTPGFGPATSAAKALAQQAVTKWVSDRCDVGGNYQEQASVLYDSFCEWAREHGVAALSLKRFGQIMSDGFERKKSGNIYYIGIRLAAAAVVED
jgi:hypothetical protein